LKILRVIMLLICLVSYVGAEEIPQYKKSKDEKIPLNAIKGKRVISGEWKISDPIYVADSGELVLSAGTQIRFAIKPDPAKQKKFGIVVRGKLLINGTKENPVVFSIKESFPEFYGLEIESEIESRISFAHFENLNFPLHVHFTPITIENCIFKNNAAAIKFVSGNVVIRNNLFIENYTAMRFWYANPVIINNRFIDNVTGLFIRGGVISPTISGNTFKNKRYDIKLSEGQEQNIDAGNNRWASIDIKKIEYSIYDKHRSDYLGKVNVLPILKNIN